MDSRFNNITIVVYEYIPTEEESLIELSCYKSLKATFGCMQLTNT